MGKFFKQRAILVQINRKDFGLTWNLALETGGFLVGDIIKIELAWEAIKQSDREERISL